MLVSNNLGSDIENNNQFNVLYLLLAAEAWDNF